MKPALNSANPDLSEGRTAFLGDAGRLLEARSALAGLPEGAAACFLARGLRPPAWVILPTEDEALRFEASLAFFASIERTAPFKILTWPAEGQPPYSGLSPRASVQAARVEALDALLMGEPVVIVAPVVSILPRVVEPERLMESSVDLRVGERIPRKELLQKLVGAGYLSMVAVEDPGSFALRGGICEIWPIGREYPIRLDFFDEEIETLRAFDPRSRRAREKLKSVHIPPAREWTPDPASLERFLEHTREHVGSEVESNALRRRVLETLKAGLSFAGVEDWLPALHPLIFALDFESRARTLFLDPASCLEEARNHLELARRRHAEMAPDERPLASPQARYASLQELEARMDSSTRILPLAMDGAVDLRMRSNEGMRVKKGDLAPLARLLSARAEEGWRTLAVASSGAEAERLQALLQPYGLGLVQGKWEGQGTDRLPPSRLCLGFGELPAGFQSPMERLCVVAARELFVDTHREDARARKPKKAQPRPRVEGLREGDWVVHTFHGIGRYLGMARLEVGGADTDFLRIAYRDDDIFYLPVHKLDQLSRFRAASEGVVPKADKLGGQSWQGRKSRVRDAMLRTAHELLQIHAQRELASIPPLPSPGSMYLRFESMFPYRETQDQVRAIQDVLEDLKSDRPMDRLVVGDVGFGKTEVAMRAAARVVEAGRQVAVLCPTTVLAYQHQETWNERFEGFPTRIAMLSRFTTPSEVRSILERTAQGEVDILVGTTKILGRKVAFKDLGLVVVDEEHRFGVRQKEHLKKIMAEAHILSLSATPIPRTLSMALSGVRSFSAISSPPEERLPISTRLARFDSALIREEILREMRRGGQVFFVHNRVGSMPALAAWLGKLVPEARVTVTHGQMPDDALEKALVGFVRRQADVLLTTAIIESGVDLPNVNCMIINRADRFGMAQLYQLRGRVGRSHRRGRCILLVPSEKGISKVAIRRLRVLQDYQELGAGFRVANEDLELRGAGELLGENQHGHMDTLGFETCMELLSDAVAEARGQIRRKRLDPEVEVPVPAFLPESLIPGVEERLQEYRRASMASRPEEIRAWLDGLEELYGALPPEAINLGWLMETRLRCRELGVDRVSWLKIRVEIHLSADHTIPAARLALRQKQLGPRMSQPSADLIQLRFNQEEARHPFRFLHWALKLLEPE